MVHDEDLALADRHVTQAEGLISQQLQHIEHMTADGQDTTLARDVLLAMEWTLLATQRHRMLLLVERNAEAASPPPGGTTGGEGRLRRYPGLDRRLPDLRGRLIGIWRKAAAPL